jgi:hypothetical protein
VEESKKWGKNPSIAGQQVAADGSAVADVVPLRVGQPAAVSSFRSRVSFGNRGRG